MDRIKLAKALGWFSIGLGVAELTMPRRMGKLIGAKRQDPRVMRLLGAREAATGVAILAQSDRSRWLWARVAGDVIDLAVLGRAARKGARRANITSAIGAVAGVMALDIAGGALLRKTA